ncbi:MAG: T9SS type A sorting domain-containing protein [Ignavibacteriales bacterium]|nr:T9SS type A sorting domain-containing protein [Ignavibacteriales bacterium]
MIKLKLNQPIVLLLAVILLVIGKLTAQTSPYLGQIPPGTQPVRFPPAAFLATADWWYHGAPNFSPDGTEMYFGKYVRIPPSSDRIEIWFSQIVNGQWTEAQKAPFNGSNGTDNSPVFSRSKDTLYFMSFRPNGFIFRVVRKNNVWSQPVTLYLPFPAGYSSGLQFSMANNGNIYGELTKPPDVDPDIYVWTLKNGVYSSPVKLANISSAQAEITPYIDPEERFIMFSSSRAGGFTPWNIYISIKKQDNSWDNPVNVGPQINATDAAYPYVSRDGKYFFFTTVRSGDSSYNPYWADANVIYGYLTDVKEKSLKKETFSLSQNYPNPFNPTTTIKYHIAEQCYCKISVSNNSGELLETLVDKVQNPGDYELSVSMNNYPSGVYFCKLTAGLNTAITKMILLK